MRDDAKRIRELLLERVAELAEYLFPNGHREANHWLVGSINGEPGKSFDICIAGEKAGLWGDFADSKRHSRNLLDLWIAARNVDFKTALREASEWLGGSSNRAAKRPASTTKPKGTFATLSNATACAALMLKMRETRRDWYHDQNGNEHLVVVRFDNEKDKSYRPFHRDESGRWVMADPPGKLPLFNLQKLLAPDLNPLSEPVFVVEGEKCVCELETLGVLVTTSAHGSNSENKTDWQPLAGRNVVILPDADKGGQDYAETVARILIQFSSRAVVKIVELPGLPPKGDCVEWLDARKTQTRDEIKSELFELIKKAEVIREPETAERDDREWATDLTSFTSLDEARFPAPLEDAAYYGLAGRIVRRIQPETEAHPAALLTNFLTGFGSLIGRNGRAAHATADGVRHYCNFFTVTVGPTSTARKGTAWKRTRPVLAMIDDDWVKDNIESGLSSGEGVIHRIRNKIEETKPIRKKGRHTGEYETVTIDPGVDDKRLLIVETEFCGALKVMNREGNTLSPVLRAAWDGDDLGTLTKHSRERATDPHVSLIGHITREELRRNLNETEAANGFGNRQLWIAVRRWQNLPKGGDLPAIADFLDPLGNALLFAQTCGELRRDDEAEELWARVYPELSEGKPGLLGAITARAAPQTLRLSVIYAVLDCSPRIRVPHLQAALAVWRYSEASARWIFETGTGSKLGDRIVAALIAAGATGLTKTQIICDVFNRNVTKFSIDEALRLIHRLGLAVRQQETTKGRPSERWFFKSGDELNELNEQREGLCR
jgi:hypothetical protein